MSDELHTHTIQFFEIYPKRCALSYGEAPCQAALGVTGTHKCYNTDGTCQDLPNYTEEDAPTLRFARPQSGLLRYGYVIPLLEVVGVTPAEVNLAGVNGDVSGLGRRERINVRLKDDKHSDHLVDKYRLERATGDASLVHSGTAQA
jgi:hypothetical protein